MKVKDRFDEKLRGPTAHFIFLSDLNFVQRSEFMRRVLGEFFFPESLTTT